MIKDLILFNRSYRRFYTEQRIDRNILINAIDLARLSPSPRNLQPYKFYVAVNPDLNDRIFETLAWAGYLVNWPGPVYNERPSGYIIILNDKKISISLDEENLNTGCGIVAQSIMLGLAEKGIGGCMIASIQRSKLANEINLSPDFEILLVLALGIPKEEVVLDELDESGDIKYWRDEAKIHHVPKRKLEDIILGD
jgi:nitroreductase